MTSSTAPRIKGTILAGPDGKGSIRMEVFYDTDAVDLWTAITEPGRLARWLATLEGDLQVGGEIAASFTSGWEGPGRIDVCEPPVRLLVTLSPGADDETTIEANLAPEGDGCRLTVEERGLSMADRPYHAAGWQVHLEDLAIELVGQSAQPWEPRWRALISTYLD